MALYWLGIDTVFTDEAGTLTYFLFVSLVAFVYCARVAASKGSRSAARATLGFALLLGSRLMHFMPLVAADPGFVLAAQISASLGLSFIFVSVFAGDDQPVRRREFLLWGIVSGIVLGGAFFLRYVDVVSVGAAVPLLTLLVTFVPAGMLLSAGRTRREMLPLAGGIALLGSTIVTAFTGLRFVASAPFWHQLVALADIAGMFLYAAAALLANTGKTTDEAPALMRKTAVSCGREGWNASLIERMVGVDSVMLNEEKGHNVLQRLVDAMAEQINANLVIVRIAKAGNELFEVGAHYGISDTGYMQTPGLSVSKRDFEKLCQSSRAHDIGFIVEWDACADIESTFIPAEIDWRGSKILVLPIYDRGLLIAFFMVGFFAEDPPAEAIPFLRFYANRAFTVVRMQKTGEKLLDKERTLALYKEELESVNQLKSNFMSVVSHELRTPLTSIKAYTETLIDNIDAIQRQTIQEFLSVMNEENERLIKLVDNILNYSRMESGNLKVEKASCDLNALIEEVHTSLGKKILAGDVNMDIRLPKRPLRIDADIELIRQLLQNLISNAVKFTPAGGRVTVLLEEEASAARIVVQDTGKGIPEDQLEKIFERFHQVDTSNTREHGGSGLGLAICKNIVEWHDGKIWVENVKEAGAKFVVLLPMKDIYVRHAPAVGYIGSRRFEREKYLTLLVELIAEFLQAKKSSIMLLDQEQQILKVIAAKGLDPEFVQNTRLEVGERIAGRVALTGEVLHVFDIEEDIDYGRANNSAFYGTHSFISVPIKKGDEVLGVLNVSDHVEGREFTKADRELLESLGTIIVTMLRKLDAYEAVSFNFERLKDAMRSILDIREAWGGKNLSNLTLLALKIGELLDLDSDSLTALRLGMNMYDLGLMKIPRNIRSKKERLTKEEIARLRSHTNIGYALVSPMGLEERIMKMIRSHHEHYDGSGYPDGLAGTEIPMEARIVNVVDSFRALVSEGPYRRCFTIDEARKEIIKSAGAKFDPRVVGAFVKALRDLGVREYKGELILDSVERELEAERRARRKGELHQRETVKEGIS
jgi:signal transduction histidine kinase/response regulator RpfG family c-di-GMP phosphodiesterase